MSSTHASGQSQQQQSCNISHSCHTLRVSCSWQSALPEAWKTHPSLRCMGAQAIS